NPSVSPENSYRLPGGETGACCVGATMDYQILRDLFTFTIEAWKELEEAVSRGDTELKSMLWQGLYQVPDMPQIEELVVQLQQILDKLPPTRIDSTGRIMEWMEEYEEPEPGHRHISHLYGLYPSDQITVDGTPQLARAASRTLEERLAHGGGHTGWSRAWIINHYAKLWQGEAAYENICRMLEQSTYPNLFDKHPPFQIDGNFGVCSGIAQMLVQSTKERVVLLPALPLEWNSGSIRGLKVVGGAELDVNWEKGEMSSFSISATVARDFLVKYREQEICLHLDAGEKYFYSKE
ncbi:MAG: glycoside hydrolase family 95 protein, partial [Lachnospiraceae bacterium]|nr:glycoside hydrolase family 95 protein [Lachnospiraceae bacterium]